MRLRVTVNADGQYFNGGAEIVISDPMSKCFEPMKAGDAGVFSALAGDLCEAECKVVMKTREDAADYIAKHIAELLVDEMKKNDTHNGYAINP